MSENPGSPKTLPELVKKIAEMCDDINSGLMNLSYKFLDLTVLLNDYGRRLEVLMKERPE